MQRVRLPVSQFNGRTAFLKIIDQSSGAWGHINCDDFQMLDTAERRVLFAAEAASPEQPAFSVRAIPSGQD